MVIVGGHRLERRLRRGCRGLSGGVCAVFRGGLLEEGWGGGLLLRSRRESPLLDQFELINRSAMESEHVRSQLWQREVHFLQCGALQTYMYSCCFSYM